MSIIGHLRAAVPIANREVPAAIKSTDFFIGVKKIRRPKNCSVPIPVSFRMYLLKAFG